MEPGSSSFSIGSDILLRDQADGPDEFMCNICMEEPRNSVLTSCGHMFCWSCLYGWTQNQVKPCPVCKIMLRNGNILPAYGCQKGSNSTDGSIPPRPIASGSPSIGGSGDSASDSDIEDEILNIGFRVSGLVWFRDSQIEFSLWIRALADFRAIRQLHPPSSAGWIAEASDRFRPSMISAHEALGPAHSLHVFIYDILVPQGEFVPSFCDFQRTWLPFYQFRNPELSPREHHDDFLESWGVHFYQAWNQAGRPAYRPLAAGTIEVSESQESDSESDVEVEWIDATENERSLQMRETRRLEERNAVEMVPLSHRVQRRRSWRIAQEYSERSRREASQERDQRRQRRIAQENAQIHRQAIRRANRQRPY